MKTLGAIVLTPHLALKFPITATKVKVMHADQKEARQCYSESLRKKQNGARTEGTKEVHRVEIG